MRKKNIFNITLPNRCQFFLKGKDPLSHLNSAKAASPAYASSLYPFFDLSPLKFFGYSFGA
jgi:hypothetical protein